MRYLKSLAIAGCVLATACSGVFGPGEMERLRAAQKQWIAQGIKEYTFEMRTSCFCPPEIVEWAAVEVRDGKVVSARSLAGVQLTGLALQSRKSVEDLFESALSYRQDWIADIDFEIDSDLSYPVRISFESKPNIADAGIVYEARNLQAKARTQ